MLDHPLTPENLRRAVAYLAWLGVEHELLATAQTEGLPDGDDRAIARAIAEAVPAERTLSRVINDVLAHQFNRQETVRRSRAAVAVTQISAAARRLRRERRADRRSRGASAHESIERRRQLREVVETAFEAWGQSLSEETINRILDAALAPGPVNSSLQDSVVAALGVGESDLSKKEAERLSAMRGGRQQKRGSIRSPQAARALVYDDPVWTPATLEYLMRALSLSPRVIAAMLSAMRSAQQAEAHDASCALCSSRHPHSAD